jgi:MFS transporter, ACS family, hexuronate transporter
VGVILQRTGSYVPIFIIAGSAYVLALGVIHLLAPRHGDREGAGGAPEGQGP